ncbi:MAG: RsmB/NOP family class I SAM-dependent RNA methyltransferase [Alphaproteobacteria bacterium]|nr:RsmB/NOP family class I SAM-dependent RNA methyltransferase [Alphaproteobacteria bacterium]
MSDAPGLAARQAALAMLSGVLGRGRSLDHQLDSLEGLATRDAGFARALVSQTLRHLGVLDAVVRHFVPKPPPPHKAGPASEILLLGACELLVLRTADHAAVNGANALAAKDKKAVHFKPLINAVLRRIAREGVDVLVGLDWVRLSVPDWLWGRWREQYDGETARRIAQAHLNEAPTDIVLKADAASFPESDGLFGRVRRLKAGGRIEAMAGFAEGDWWVQDAAATLPANLLGDVRGRRVIDLCAAPGGKTMQLAAAGALVTAVEIDPVRAGRIRENLARTGLCATIVEGDAREVQLTAPLVLVDAPCTATGTIRRHPDLPWIKQAGDVTHASAMAYEILEAGAAMVEPGGTLVFAVCSLEREEGEEQIAAFLSAHPEFSRAPLSSDDVFGHGEWITPDGDLRTLPFHLGGMDGFYAARLKRSQTPQGIGDGQIHLAGVGGEQRRGQKAAAIAFPRPVQQHLELADIGVGGIVEHLVVAIEAGDAVHRLGVDGAGQAAREHAAVAHQILFPFHRAGRLFVQL